MAAGEGESVQSHEALHQLCVIYRAPIHSFLLRNGHKEQRAEDLASGFIEHLLEKNRFEGFKKTDTKFRSFLLKCLKRFVLDVIRKEMAEKRGGGLEPLDLDEIEIGKTAEIEKTLDFDFAKAVHRQAMDRLASEKYAEGAKQQRFAVLRRFVWGHDESVSYEEVARRLQMTTNAVSKAVFDLRQAYYEYFRRVVRETVTPEMIAEETRYLMTLLAESGVASEL